MSEQSQATIANRRQQLDEVILSLQRLRNAGSDESSAGGRVPPRGVRSQMVAAHTAYIVVHHRPRWHQPKRQNRTGECGWGSDRPGC